MPTFSFRISDEIYERMQAHDVNWSAVLRDLLADELATREERNLAAAVAASERLSAEIDPADVAAQDSAEIIREYRQRR